MASWKIIAQNNGIELNYGEIRKKQNKSAEKYKTKALKNSEHPKAMYREPSALIIICATATMGYTTDNGVKIIPIGCLRD